MPKNVSRELRKYIYGIAIAAVPVAVHYELISVEASVLILPLILALLNLTPKEVQAVEGVPVQDEVDPDLVDDPELDDATVEPDELDDDDLYPSRRSIREAS